MSLQLPPTYETLVSRSKLAMVWEMLQFSINLQTETFEIVSLNISPNISGHSLY